MKLFALLTASVFPEPVCAIPTISLPLMAIGQPWAWMAVGSSNACLLKKKFIINTRACINYLTINLQSLVFTWSHSWHSLGNCPLQNTGWDVEHYSLSLLFLWEICTLSLHAWAWNKINSEITVFVSITFASLHRPHLTLWTLMLTQKTLPVHNIWMWYIEIFAEWLQAAHIPSWFP